MLGLEAVPDIENLYFLSFKGLSTRGLVRADFLQTPAPRLHRHRKKSVAPAPRPHRHRAEFETPAPKSHQHRVKMAAPTPDWHRHRVKFHCGIFQSYSGVTREGKQYKIGFLKVQSFIALLVNKLVVHS